MLAASRGLSGEDRCDCDLLRPSSVKLNYYDRYRRPAPGRRYLPLDRACRHTPALSMGRREPDASSREDESRATFDVQMCRRSSATTVTVRRSEIGTTLKNSRLLPAPYSLRAPKVNSAIREIGRHDTDPSRRGRLRSNYRSSAPFLRRFSRAERTRRVQESPRSRSAIRRPVIATGSIGRDGGRQSRSCAALKRRSSSGVLRQRAPIS